MIDLLNENPDLLSKVDRGMVVKDLKCSIPNYLEQAEMLEWAGIGFGENFNFMVQKSLKRLAKISGAKSLQLFGKVLATEQDYWVAQGVLTESEEVPSNKLQELRGKGVNASVFWVTHNLMGDWIQLPDAEPEHIMGARMMKKMLTGNLNASVDSCPPFNGKERNLLRA
jgi:radial spoke head protein 4/6